MRSIIQRLEKRMTPIPICSVTPTLLQHDPLFRGGIKGGEGVFAAISDGWLFLGC